VEVIEAFVDRLLIIAHTLAGVLGHFHRQAEILERPLGQREAVRIGNIRRRSY
jgi:hypothetical protein